MRCSVGQLVLRGGGRRRKAPADPDVEIPHKKARGKARQNATAEVWEAASPTAGLAPSSPAAVGSPNGGLTKRLVAPSPCIKCGDPDHCYAACPQVAAEKREKSNGGKGVAKSLVAGECWSPDTLAEDAYAEALGTALWAGKAAANPSLPDQATGTSSHPPACPPATWLLCLPAPACLSPAVARAPTSPAGPPHPSAPIPPGRRVSRRWAAEEALFFREDRAAGAPGKCLFRAVTTPRGCQCGCAWMRERKRDGGRIQECSEKRARCLPGGGSQQRGGACRRGAGWSRLRWSACRLRGSTCRGRQRGSTCRTAPGGGSGSDGGGGGRARDGGGGGAARGGGAGIRARGGRGAG